MILVATFLLLMSDPGPGIQGDIGPVPVGPLNYPIEGIQGDVGAFPESLRPLPHPSEVSGDIENVAGIVFGTGDGR